MIIAAILAALTVFMMIFAVGKVLGPKGEIGKKKEISQRIFSTPGANEPSSLVRHDHFSDITSIQKFMEKQDFSKDLALLLKRANSRFSLTSFLLLSSSLAVVTFVVAQFWLPFIAALGLGGMCLYLPVFYLRKQNERYITKFAEHLPDATSIVSNSLKIGQSIENALQAVSRNAPFPINVEFQTLAGEVKLGLPLDAGLRNLYARLKTPELKIFVTGITIQQELGGNLSEILENLERTIRERFALNREIKVLSAQGVLSMWVLFALPFVFAGIWLTAEKELLMDFVNSGFGQKLLMFSAVIQMIAFVWMKKVITIKD